MAHACWTEVFVLFCFVLAVASGAHEKRYFGVGVKFELELPPNASATPLTSIIWKHNGNFIIEWDPKSGLEVYPAFDGRVSFNATTRLLTITNPIATDAGVYTVEVNKEMKTDGYDAVLIEKVPEPKLRELPGSSDDERVLICDGADEEKTGTLEYFWNFIEPGDPEEESWKKNERKITLKKNETTKSIRSIVCKIVNLIGEEESKELKNPFYEEPGSTDALGALALIPILILILVVGLVWYFKKEAIMKWWRNVRGGNEGNGAAANPAVNPEEGNQLNPKKSG